MVCLDDLKLSAMAPGVRAFTATNRRIALLVGSAIAWNTSLLDFIMQLFDSKYKCSYLTAQIFFEKIFQKSKVMLTGAVPVSLPLNLSDCQPVCFTRHPSPIPP
jgi:hypothetical protein